MRPQHIRTFCLTCAFVFLAMLVKSLSAGTFTVTRFDDPVRDACLAGDCSLREAVHAANQSVADDEIILSAGVYELTQEGRDEEKNDTGDLDIGGNLVIRGAGIFDTIIDGNRIDRVFDVDPSLNNVRVEFVDLAVINGDADGNGGGIQNRGTLTLTRVSVNDNFVTGFGGGIDNRDGATLTIIESVVAENQAEGGAAGIRNTSSTLTIEDSAIIDNEVLDSSGNDGGGIYTVGEASLSVSGSLISGNHARFNGGGIHASATSSITVTDTEISENTAGSRGGALRDFGTAVITFTRCTIRDNRAPTNHGGGLYVLAGDASAGEFNLIDSTVSGNESGAAGGGVHIGPFKTANIINSTISGNTAAEEGGGVYVTGTGTVANILSSTIVNNIADGASDITERGGGLNATGPEAVNLSHTILANNFAGAADSDCFGNITSGGFNLIEDLSFRCVLGGDPTGNIDGVDPLLGPLADNGGPTQTHALLDGSPAIDAGGPNCEAADQRGESRAKDGDDDGAALCDIGSFEKAAVPTAPPVQFNNNACGATLGMISPFMVGLGLASMRRQIRPCRR